jgi:hypothetical protein
VCNNAPRARRFELDLIRELHPGPRHGNGRR